MFRIVRTEASALTRRCTKWGPRKLRTEAVPLDGLKPVIHGIAMRCENCGAPLVAPSNPSKGCPYCGSATAPNTKENGIGSLVDQLFEQMRTGAPDAPDFGIPKGTHFVQQTTVTVNGKQYGDVDQLPPELRQAVNHGLAIAQQMGQNSGILTRSSITVDATELEDKSPHRTSEAIRASRLGPRPLTIGILILMLLLGVVWLAW